MVGSSRAKNLLVAAQTSIMKNAYMKDVETVVGTVWNAYIYNSVKVIIGGMRAKMKNQSEYWVKKSNEVMRSVRS